MVTNENIWKELENICNPPPIDKPVVSVTKQPVTNLAKSKRTKIKKPAIPKEWNAIVLKPVKDKDGNIVATEGWFEYVESAEGRTRNYVDEGLLLTIKKPIYILTQEKEGEYEPYIPPEYIEYLPEKLHRAAKGCDAYSMFLSFKRAFMEKLKTFLLFGIMGMMVFLIFIMLSEK